MRTLFVILVLGFATPLQAAELRLYPADIPLTGPKAAQQLLVVSEENGQALADSGKGATFASSNPKVAIVEEGRVRAVGDGEAVVTVKTVDGKEATAKVRVSGAGEVSSPTFRNHIIPIMTRSGCNSGACHGALAGKGGLKLSLRGYDPDTDHFVLTRQALSRRVDRSEPEKSLMLLKATRTLPHGGGRRIEAGEGEGEGDYQVVLDWIKAGTMAPQASDAALDRIELLPRSALLAPKSELPVLVRAWYTDGRVEDVTREPLRL